MQKATKHRNFAGSGTFQPLCTKVHHAAPDWCRGAPLVHYHALVHYYALVHNYALVHLYRNITVVPSWHRRNSLAHMCRNIPLEHYFALVYFSSEAPPILILLQCKSALLTLV